MLIVRNGAKSFSLCSSPQSDEVVICCVHELRFAFCSARVSLILVFTQVLCKLARRHHCVGDSVQGLQQSLDIPHHDCWVHFDAASWTQPRLARFVYLLVDLFLKLRGVPVYGMPCTAQAGLESVP